ncbi:WxcM-like domain-containing protein [Lusitaniella coriacea LEGE 07157]|uniref:WxcM-like domain-containing protein n=1 Tax=Lusitaniella coriacea LEGE 07157 TaxID=945747 RepID=A0A8J7DX16_9CYAN|nr:FdtA/QdtA family cupin domain-containing protein [Lusitaniella coriacea]MBE9116799.1 WxcM-like domain-containing protein [Lusitaniella coriacea LEGE 07157]
MLLNKSTPSILNENLLLCFPEYGTIEQGFLSVAESEKNCPFPIQRTYWVYGCPEGKQRGGHAHRSVHQILICVAGEVEVILDNGVEKEAFILNNPTIGLHQKPLVWGDLIHKKDSALIVLASEHYSEPEYIRNYNEFLKIVAS